MGLSQEQSVHPLPFLLAGKLNLQPNFQNKVWEREGWGEFAILYIENKSKSEIFNKKKMFVNKNVFFCHNLEFKLRNFS